MSGKMLPTLFLIVAVAIAGYLMFFGRGDVSSAQARQLVQAGAKLVDVRTPAEFAAGHIAGAINIPVQQLDARLQELEQGSAVVLYCRSGRRSGSAARILKAAGFAAVHDLGPMARW